MKEFKQNNLTIVFYQKEGDLKYSFLVKDKPELTERLLLTVKTKRVKENKIKYAVNGIFDLIENDLLTKKLNKMENPIIQLAELVQKQSGLNIETKVTGKTGADHMPIVSVEIKLPNGQVFKATGSNKRIAKQKAAEKALEELY